MSAFTKAQIRKIIVLRAKGYGHRRISETLEMPENVLKYYFKCNPATFISVKCKNCEKEVRCIPTYRKKVFCSDECRMTWWSKHQDEINHKMYHHTCIVCGREFDSFRANSISCSKRCNGTLKGKGGVGNDQRNV